MSEILTGAKFVGAGAASVLSNALLYCFDKSISLTLLSI